MQVIRAKVLGFCMGVRRAVETAVNALDQNRDGTKKIFTLGPLIHNPTVLASLEERGLRLLDADNMDEVDSSSVVVIRAHGTTPDVLSRLESRKAAVLDATCPRVHLSQKRAREWSEKGFDIIIAGDRNHGEVVSISSYAKTPVTVIESAEEAEKLFLPENSVLIAQTTFSPVEFEKICTILKRKNSQLQVFNSICSATMERQNALSELEGKADGLLIIGGKNSANTRRLYDSGTRYFSKCHLVENELEIPACFMAMERVAISAGASTPDSTIDAVENALILGQT